MPHAWLSSDDLHTFGIYDYSYDDQFKHECNDYSYTLGLYSGSF